MSSVPSNPFVSKARQFGIEDGKAGVERRAWEYFLPGGAAEDAYKLGYLLGMAQRQPKRLAGGSEAAYVPFSDPSLNSVQPAEYRDEHIGM